MPAAGLSGSQPSGSAGDAGWRSGISPGPTIARSRAFDSRPCYMHAAFHLIRRYRRRRLAVLVARHLKEFPAALEDFDRADGIVARHSGVWPSSIVLANGRRIAYAPPTVPMDDKPASYWMVFWTGAFAGASLACGQRAIVDIREGRPHWVVVQAACCVIGLLVTAWIVAPEL